MLLKKHFQSVAFFHSSQNKLYCFFYIFLNFLHTFTYAQTSSTTNLTQTLLDDQKKFYINNSVKFLPFFFTSVTLANSDYDKLIIDYYHNRIHSKNTDNLAKFSKNFGETLFITIYPITFLSTYLFANNKLSDNNLYQWTYRSTRSIILGAPIMLLIQRLLGAKRPDSPNAHSNYKPFTHKYAVSASGHAFMGAIPFLNLAYMTDSLWLKSFLFASSTLTGLSRLNDKKHYLSQIILGWSLAFLATETIHTKNIKTNFTIIPSDEKIIISYKKDI
jgi:hypothetical protein